MADESPYRQALNEAQQNSGDFVQLDPDAPKGSKAEQLQEAYAQAARDRELHEFVPLVGDAREIGINEANDKGITHEAVLWGLGEHPDFSISNPIFIRNPEEDAVYPVMDRRGRNVDHIRGVILTESGVDLPIKDYVVAEHPGMRAEFAALGGDVTNLGAEETIDFFDAIVSDERFLGDMGPNFTTADPDYDPLTEFAKFVGVDPSELGVSTGRWRGQNGQTGVYRKSPGDAYGEPGEMIGVMDVDGAITSIIPGENELTPIESQLLDAFKRAGVDVKTQFIIGNFRADFAIPEKKLIIEADGADYHSSQEQIDSDNARTSALRALGWEVIRFSGSEIYNGADALVPKVMEAANARETVEDVPQSAPFQTGKKFQNVPQKPTWVPTDVQQELAWMSPEEIANFQADMIEAGELSNVTQFRLGVADDATQAAMAKVLGTANQQGWVDRDSKEWKKAVSFMINNPFPASVKPKSGSGSDLDRPYIAPDYDTLTETVYNQFNGFLGRDPSENELNQMAARLSSDYRERYEAEQEALAFAEENGLPNDEALEIIRSRPVAEAREAILERLRDPGTGVGSFATVQNVDPAASLSAYLRETYKGEIEQDRQVASARITRDNLMSSILRMDTKI